MKVKLFLIIFGFINAQEKEAFEHYASNMRTLYEQVDAKIVDRYPIAQTLIGEDSPDFMLVVEFPDQEAFVELFSSKAYQDLVPYRQKGFEKLQVYVSKK